MTPKKRNKTMKIRIMARITLVTNKLYQEFKLDISFKMQESIYSTDKKKFGRIRNGTKKISAFLKALPFRVVVVAILLLFLPLSPTEYPTDLKNIIELISPII